MESKEKCVMLMLTKCHAHPSLCTTSHVQKSQRRCFIIIVVPILSESTTNQYKGRIGLWVRFPMTAAYLSGGAYYLLCVVNQC